MNLILYSKPGCHLCEGLEAKLAAIPQIASDLDLSVETRDITSRDDWFAQYQYEIPVLVYDASDGTLHNIPRPSPRSSVPQLAQMLQKFLAQIG